MRDSASTVVNVVISSLHAPTKEREVSTDVFSYTLPLKISFDDQFKSALNLIHQALVDELRIPTTPYIPAITVTTVNN